MNTSNRNGERRAEEEIREWLVENISITLSICADEVDVDRPFNDFGLDSTDALRLSTELGAWLGCDVAATSAWYYPTIRELAQHLASK